MRPSALVRILQRDGQLQRRGEMFPGGPDVPRRTSPGGGAPPAAGYRRWPDADVAAVADRVIAARMTRPDGPAASLT